GFGLAVLEALACDVPVLATPVGVHPEALAAVHGTLCAPFDLARWRAALEPHLRTPDPRVEGRAAATRFSAQAMAERVAAAWREELERSEQPSG
ncbi:MAG TPA: glycosyltransferase, partial [Solirubrobacteraceae bacterium]|nr:glycosyltransferase [Solirubrobacteraceae bacterium]